MPARSKNQAIAMNLAQAVQRGQASAKPGSPSAEIAKSMKPSALADFAGPIPPGLPKKVGKPAPAAPVKKPMRVKNVGKPVKQFRF